MSELDDLKARHAQVLTILEHQKLDSPTLAIIRSALEADQRMKIIRDAFIEGRDHEAVHMIRELDPIGPRALLPMSSTWQDIAPAQTCQITARPQLPFQPTHLLVSARCRNFIINDIRVANRSEFVQAGDIPADVFGVEEPALEAAMAETQDNPDGTSPIFTIKVNAKVGRVGIALDLPIVHAGWDVVIIVTNDGNETMPFRACWLGQVKYISPPLAIATLPVTALATQADPAEPQEPPPGEPPPIEPDP